AGFDKAPPVHLVSRVALVSDFFSLLAHLNSPFPVLSSHSSPTPFPTPLITHHSSLLPHIPGDLFMRRKPNTRSRFHIGDQPFHDRVSGSVAGYMGMHGQYEHRTLLVSSIEF